MKDQMMPKTTIIILAAWASMAQCLLGSSSLFQCLLVYGVQLADINSTDQTDSTIFKFSGCGVDHVVSLLAADQPDPVWLKLDEYDRIISDN